jgi:hypothetical protein
VFAGSFLYSERLEEVEMEDLNPPDQHRPPSHERAPRQSR